MRGHPSRDMRALYLYTHSKKRKRELEAKRTMSRGVLRGAITPSSHKLVFTSITAPNFNQAVCIYSRAAFINGGINDTLLQHKHEGVWRLCLVRQQLRWRWGRELIYSCRASVRVCVCALTLILICLGPDQETQALS